MLETTPSSPTESDAVRAALTGTALDRARVAGRALRTLLRDPEQTESVFVIAIALNRRRLPQLAAQFLADEDGAWLMEHQPALDSHQVDHDWLRTLPAGTLGREYVRFLDDNGLDADFFQAPPGLPPLVRYLAQRMRQTHDLWHVVTGYGSHPAGETELQGFYFGQTGMPSSGLIALGGSIRGLPDVHDLPLRVARAYRRGRRARRLAPLRWELHWDRPLAALRRELSL
jgi:ubiquinone biosynthesis protein COQ4